MLKQNSVFKKVLSLLLSIVFAISSFTVAGFSSLSALADDGDYYMFAYFTGNEDTRQYDNNNQAIRFAVSTDGLNFKALNDNKPAIEQLGGSLNVRDPYLFKGADDYYYIIGTDLDCITMGWWGNQPQMVLWRSLDLVNWTDETYINTAQICGLNNNQVYRTWAPQVFYDEASGKYMVYFAFAADGYNSTNMYYMMTSDLLDQSKYSLPQQLYRPFDDPANPCYQNSNKDCIDADITYQNGTYYMFYKDEGASTVCLATSTKLNEDYRYVGKCATSTETANIEGCEVYKIGNNYYLVADRFSAAGRFAIYNLGSNLAAITATDGSINMNNGSPITTVDGLNGFENLSVRHGSIMRINKTQYDALIAKYGISDQNDVRFVFDRAYSAEDSWHYDTIKDASGYNFSLMTNTGGYSYVHSQSNCVAINGATMFIQDGDIKNMFDTGKSWTVSFNANIVSKRGAPLFALTSGAEVNGVNSKDWIRFLDNGDFYINNGSEYVKKGSTDITTTTDYDFDITYNGTDITLYKDGVKQFTSNIGTLGFDKNGVTSYTAWGWTDTCGVTGVNATYTNIRYRSKAISYAEVSKEYTDNLIYQYNEGTHEAIDGRANVTYNSPKTTTTYVGKRGSSFAVAGWVNIGAQKHDGAVLFEFGEGGTGDGKNYLSLLEDGTIKWCWSEGSTPRYVDIGSIYDFAVNTYYYVQINVVPDGSQYHFQAFVDGVSVMDVTSGYTSMVTQAYGPINFLSNNRQLRFGQGNAYWTTAGYNIIDDIRVYNRAVDAAALYADVKAEDNAVNAESNVNNWSAPSASVTPSIGSGSSNGSDNKIVSQGYYSNILYYSDTRNDYKLYTGIDRGTAHIYYPIITALYDGTNDIIVPVAFGSKRNGSNNSSYFVRVYTTTSGFSMKDDYWHGYNDRICWATSTSYRISAMSNISDGSQQNNNSSTTRSWGNAIVYTGTPTDILTEITTTSWYVGLNRSSMSNSSSNPSYNGTLTSSSSTSADTYMPIRIINVVPLVNAVNEVKAANSAYSKIQENPDYYTESSKLRYLSAVADLTGFNVNSYFATNTKNEYSSCASKMASVISEYNNAKNALAVRADFSQLDAKYASAQDILNNRSDDYTAATISALQSAFDSATYSVANADERANMSSDIYQSEINTEKNALTDAIEALVAKKTVTFVEYGGTSTTVKFDQDVATAADVEAAAPSLPANNYDSAANKHYTYAWDNAFAAPTANATYTQERSEVAHVYGNFTHIDGTHTHSASCSVNGQSHTDTLSCVYEEESFEATSTTNSFTRYTCKDCNNSYDGNYGVQNWTAYDEAVAAYDAADDEAGFTAKYTEASRTAYANAASSKLTKAETVPQSAINAAATALEEAVSGLTVQNYTITFDKFGTDEDVLVSLAYGTTAEAVAAEAPALKEANHNDTYHYTYAWNTSFAAVTGAATYTEVETETAHSYSAVHTDADGDANGYTTYTCECGQSYVEYDTQDFTDYATAYADYEATIGAEDYEAHYTAASRTAYEAAVAEAAIDTTDETLSSTVIANAAAEITAAKDELVVQTYTIRFRPDGVYSSSTYVNLPYGTTAEEVATYAPANTNPKFANQYQHRVYTWPEFATVTANAYYDEQDTKESHTITDEYHAADGETNGYTTHTCYICGGTQHETYDERDYSAYTAAVEDYETTKASEDYAKYTDASKTAYEEVVDAIINSVSIYDKTKSTLYYQNRAAEIIAAKDGLEEAHDNGYNLTLEDDIEVNFYIDTESYDAEDGYITYTFLKDPAEFSAEREEVVIQDDSELLVKLPDGRRKLNVQVAPAQLAEKFQINVYDKYGNKKTDEAIETSISDYCESLLGIEAYSEYHAVVQTLLDYGALADEYFGYAAISKEVTGEDYEVPHSAGYKDAVDAESFKAKAKSSFVAGTDASGAQLRITGVSYVALVDPEFRFYVNQENEVWCYYTDLSISDPSLKAEWIKTEHGNCVRVTGLKASDFGKNFTITIGTAELTYNGYAYLYTNLREASTLSAALKNLSKGVYRYAVACEETFNKD